MGRPSEGQRLLLGSDAESAFEVTLVGSTGGLEALRALVCLGGHGGDQARAKGLMPSTRLGRIVV